MITLKIKELSSIFQSESEFASKSLIGLDDSDAVFQGVSTDTRTIQPGHLFFALVGEHFDGHAFLDNAQANGAVAAVVSKPSPHLSIPQLVVPDTLNALGRLGAFWRSRFNVPVVGITGSHGKTTVKEMTASILAAHFGEPSFVLATQGNLNNAIGLPLNLMHIDPKHRVCVFELGMSSFGEIEYLMQLARPSVGVITNAHEAHLAGVLSVEGVAKAKGELIEGLQEGAPIILNADDPHFGFWKNLAVNQEVIAFSLDKTLDVFARDIHEKADGISFTLCSPLGEKRITLPAPGRHNVQNALAACAACLALGVDLDACEKGLRAFKKAAGRLALMPGKKGAIVIDDAYNAAPASTRAAIDVLAAYGSEGKRPILVLGDMKELGQSERQLHFQIGEYAKAHSIEFLFGVGDLMLEACKGFGHNAYHFESKAALSQALLERLDENYVVLVKGSHSMGMTEVVRGLKD